MKTRFELIEQGSKLYRVTLLKMLNRAESDESFHRLRYLVAQNLFTKEELDSDEFKGLWVDDLINSSKRHSEAHSHLKITHFVHVNEAAELLQLMNLKKNISKVNILELIKNQ